MAGPWLYSIGEGPDRTFDIDDGSIPVSAETFQSLIESKRLYEDKSWKFSQLGGQIEIGDALFIYVGKRDLGIIGYATISAVTKLDRGWTLEPTFDFAKSRILLERPISALIVRSWQLKLQRNVVDLSARSSELQSLLPWHQSTFSFPEEIAETATYIEGSAKQVLVNRYERDPKARQACIERFGPTCAACGFDFGATYGKIVAGLIHVHHLRPLATLGTGYVVDPVIDLRPICPNCHSVIHRREPPFSIEEVRSLIRDAAESA
jgi:hypothetical protein